MPLFLIQCTKNHGARAEGTYQNRKEHQCRTHGLDQWRATVLYRQQQHLKETKPNEELVLKSYFYSNVTKMVE